MGIIVNKEKDQKDYISKRINTDLSSKMSFSDATHKNTQGSADYKPTSKFGWLWFVLIVIVIVALILIVII